MYAYISIFTSKRISFYVYRRNLLLVMSAIEVSVLEIVSSVTVSAPFYGGEVTGLVQISHSNQYASIVFNKLYLNLRSICQDSLWLTIVIIIISF